MNKKFLLLIILIILGITISYCMRKYQAYQNQRIYDLRDQEFFSKIYEKNVWDGSGIGSKPENSMLYLTLLQEIFNDPKYKTIFDLGCGDWQLMSQIKIPGTKIYNGYDIVNSVIDSNKKIYSKNNIHFYHIAGLGDFSKVKGDLLIVKDVIQHWSDEQVRYFFKNILSNFKFALITNDFSKAPVTFFGEKKLEHGNTINLADPKYKVEDNIKTLLDYYVKDEMKRVYLYTNPNK